VSNFSLPAPGSKPIIMTRQELQEAYASYSTNQLLEILDNKFHYTELAVSVALEELGKRKPDENDIAAYKEEREAVLLQSIHYNYIEGLSIGQKILFFFLFIPFIRGIIAQNFIDDGKILKLKQASYYSWTGFILLMLIVLISSLLIDHGVSSLAVFSIWFLSFLIPYALDEKYIRPAQISRIRRELGIKEEEE